MGRRQIYARCSKCGGLLEKSPHRDRRCFCHIKNEVVALRQELLPASEIGRRLDLNLSTVNSIILLELGADDPFPKRVRELVETGLGRKTVARMLGIPEGSVRAACPSPHTWQEYLERASNHFVETGLTVRDRRRLDAHARRLWRAAYRRPVKKRERKWLHPKRYSLWERGSHFECNECREVKPKTDFYYYPSQERHSMCCKRCENKKGVDELSDKYLKKVLTKRSGLDFCDVPPELIELKRLELTLKRELWKEVRD